MADLTTIVYYLVAVVIAITIHEFFHAWAADRLGDPTAKYMGRLSLNPLVHFDPLGALMILFMALGGRGLGWGKPVPVNPNNLRPGPIVGEAIVSLMGPLSNLLTAAVAALPLRLVAMHILPPSALPVNLFIFLYILFATSIVLCVFNLLPIYPLDGYHFWLGLLHELPFRPARQLWIALSGGPFQTYGPVILLVLVFWGRNVLWAIMDPVISFLGRLLLGTPGLL